jgi:membrane-associated protein
MEWLNQILDIAIHLDKHVAELVSQYGYWTYAILFLIIFSETGFVVTPFLPGDSLLFAAGAIASTGALSPHLIVVLLAVAGILGDSVNYSIGHFIGPRAFTGKYRFFKKEYLIRTHEFYERYGGKTIVIARFVPIIRTFAPFVAGIGAMTYSRFIFYNIAGAILWVASITYAGYFFGNITWVKNNFSVVILAIIIISVIPMIVEWIRHLIRKRRNASEVKAKP